MTERKKKFEELRKKYDLDSGSVDDVVEQLEGEHEILKDEEGIEYVMLNCPFEADFDCKYGWVEDWHDSGEEELLYTSMAAHMLTGHLELEDE